MCGIAGFVDLKQNLLDNADGNLEILIKMRRVLDRRGPDDHGEYLSECAGLSHARLSIRDLAHGRQPMIKRRNNGEYALVYNGEIYNTDELKRDLRSRGCVFTTTSDTEVILWGLMEYGIDFVKELNGIFAFAFWDNANRVLYLARDRVGVKPLFYSMIGDTLVFGSEIKPLFQYPGIQPVLNRQSLCEIFGVGPARTHGVGVFKGVNEVKPGYAARLDINGFAETPYWVLRSAPHTDNYAETIDKVKYLVLDSIKRQLVSDVPICSFLSGGLDSSLVTAVARRELGTINTYSFDFTDNRRYFASSGFQAEEDWPYVNIMKDALGANHIYLECDYDELADYLYISVDAKDLPGMADIDASLLYFCERVKLHNKVAITGECADEIFGGYPWFHRKDMFDRRMFPWSYDMESRQSLLRDELVNALDITEYALSRYEESLAEVPVLEGETGEEKRRREIAFLNLKWFMSTLLDRMDRASMYTGLEARVPYADHRIIEYVFNAPWSVKCKDGAVKNLLREAAAGLLPAEVLRRKKSPYPKTYHPQYEALIKSRLADTLRDKNEPVNELIAADKVTRYMNESFDYGKPWFGQLMAGPQMIAYLLQINYWMKKYKISIEL
ncbi:MAG: asparagine synthase (glutamine-hydrolyzing) [Clostridiales bacterium]|jgi:asparagine synthase (glutamine-hydrolysing)|nr:asparagine synthase (glutamine-hydrolyzing) [Clostridiales bacterium]